MESILQIIFILGVLILLILLVLRPWKRARELIPLPESYKRLLNENVVFYRQLDMEGKKMFEQKMEQFFSDVRITGVNTVVEDIDKVLIGASAIIPIYAFPKWEYVNLNEVLLYPDAFSIEFEQQGHHRSVTGMVGYGALQNVMILSKNALRQDFLNTTGIRNTAIHEFAHLIDKSDGSIDGVPEALLKYRYIMPWIKMIRENMESMMKEESDIDYYGISNPAEFFAVVSEYFFSRPDLLQAKHPELYVMLEKMFLRREPGH